MVEGTSRGDAGHDEELLRESLRQALYRPGISLQDLEEYQRLSRPSEPERLEDQGVARQSTAAPPRRRRRRRRRQLIWAAAASAAVIICAGVGFAITAVHDRVTKVAPTPSASGTLDLVDSTRTRHLLARDDGTQPYAEGPASLMSAGKFSYTTRSGDTVLGIAGRFHVCISDVLGGMPLAAQGHLLTPGLPMTIELGPWPLHPDGTVDCVEDEPAS